MKGRRKQLKPPQWLQPRVLQLTMTWRMITKWRRSLMRRPPDWKLRPILKINLKSIRRRRRTMVTSQKTIQI